ncbi:DUF2612 domain-containing protein [Enterobacter sp. WCHEn045836]|uniref:DUF2612 domain-containing protein n=1 Tax=Enterobacter sp. WCHEn045836 TaxID=2497434 RepID=UPI000F82C54B|nr:DUF2612 domain-containing protein [Enterobacter sp. WCHEn045836]RTQ01309.1 DUF2612 domain-containing protein [Enterobacter sp. WCHEn045836]
MSEFSDKAKSRIYWQYKNAPKLIEWIMSLPDVAQGRIVEQVAKVRNILDIDNAEGEQLNICGRIAGYRKRPVGKFVPGCEVAEVDDVLYRKMIKAKICKNNGIATIDDVKAAADYILDVSTTVLDGQDMTMRLVWKEDTVSIAVQKLVEEYDLIPRPQGVGMRKHRVIKRKPFGFGPHFSNFGNAPFWYGDGTPPVHYYGSIKLVRRKNVVAGKIIIDDVDVADQDVAIIITHANGNQTVRYVVTDSQGRFAIGGLPVPSVIVARVMLVLPTCNVLELGSEPLSVS